MRQSLRTDQTADIAYGSVAAPAASVPDSVVSGLASVLDGGALLPEPAPWTLGEALIRAAGQPDAGHIVYLDDEGRGTAQSYAELLGEARLILRAIDASKPSDASEGPQPGDRVLLQIRTEPELLAAFWACVLGGYIPVPITPTPPPGSTFSAPELLAGMWSKLGGAWVISDEPVEPSADHAASRLGDVRTLRATGADAASRDDADGEPLYRAAAPDDLAALLLTSGSTGLPKAVALTHRNIISRAAASARVRGLTSRNRTFNWMPLDHVGGLVMFHVRDVWLGCHQVHARIGWVLGDPLRWLEAISEHRCDTTWAPNFAFGLVADRAGQSAGHDWDLSRLTYIMNGGEAVKPQIARVFLDMLAPYGVPDTAMHPGWGMSETSGGVVDSVFDSSSAPYADRFVPVGVPHPGVSLRVVGPDGSIVPQGTVGSLQARGLPITGGYYADSAQNRQSFTADGWFKTGDQAVIEDGRLTVTGRTDDAIEIGQVTYFGHEIESAVEELPFVEPSYTVVCPLPQQADEVDGEAEVAVFYHPRSGPSTDQERWQIVERVAQRFGLRVAVVRPVAREDVPKTGIGKLRRSALLRLL